MVVYLFYIFDRHTECVYLKSWLPTTPSRSSQPPIEPPTSTSTSTATATATAAPSAGATPPGLPPAQPPQQHEQNQHPQQQQSSSSSSSPPPPPQQQLQALPTSVSAASDDAKLVFGTVFSLRNMARKLGGDDDAFISYRTAQYKLHFYETPANLRFVLITDTASASMRNVLHQIYINLWVEYVVKNPLAPVEHKGGQGVKNELFELGLDQFIRGLV